jgi:hypothetical protein
MAQMSAGQHINDKGSKNSVSLDDFKQHEDEIVKI